MRNFSDSLHFHCTGHRSQIPSLVEELRSYVAHAMHSTAEQSSLGRKGQRCGLAGRSLFLFILQIDNIVLMKDSETGRSKGYGFITVSL